MPTPRVAWGVWVFFACILKTAPLPKHFPKKWIAFRLPLIINAFGHLGCLSAFLLPPFQQHFLLSNFRITPSFTFSRPPACCQPLFFMATSESHCLSCFLVHRQPPLLHSELDARWPNIGTCGHARQRQGFKGMG